MTETTPKSLTINDIIRAKNLVDSIPKQTDWMLASPDGRVWKGSPEELLMVISKHLPLFSII